MKLFLFICCLNIYWLSSLYANGKNNQINLQIANGLVIDYDSKTVLYQKHATRKIYPASLTKLMTIYIVFNEIKAGRLSLNQEAKVSVNAYHKGNASTGGSTLFLEAGQKVKIKDLIKGIIVVSGNDASIVLAELIAGSEANFIQLMNKTAKEIGLTQTHFTNADGIYNQNHYSTAQDLVILSDKLISKFFDYYFLFSIKSFTYNNIQQYNRNPLLNYYSDNFVVDGIKTGHIKQSKYSLAFSTVKKHTAQQSNHEFRLIGVTIGAVTSSARKTEAIKLINWIYNKFSSYKIFNQGEIIAKIPVLYGFNYTYHISLNKDIFITLPNAVEFKDINIKLLHPKYIIYNIKKGDKIAELQITTLDKKYKKYNISYDILAESDISHNYKAIEIFLLPYTALKKLISQI